MVPGTTTSVGASSSASLFLLIHSTVVLCFTQNLASTPPTYALSCTYLS